MEEKMKMRAVIIRPFLFSLLITLAGTSTAYAQSDGTPSIGGFPMGGFGSMGLSLEEMQNMTPEEAQAMAQRLMLQMGGQLGVNQTALENATLDEQEDLIRQAAKSQAGGILGQMEQMFGMSVQDMQNLDAAGKAELRANISSDFQASIGGQTDALPMQPAPPGGFRDGSTSLPVQPDFSTVLTVENPADQEVLLVVADLTRREIVWREPRNTPFSEHFNLLELARNPNTLVLELINPHTGRVIERFRPVAAE
jgi:hypothetical protein